MPETSIVIRTFNEERHLPALLDGLSQQIYRDFEVVVVDSGSFDHTREIARRRADRLVCIESDDFTFGHSLNVGVRNSVGRYIGIVSAHVLPADPHWLEQLLSPLDAAGTAMVYGRQAGRSDSKLSESLDFERTFGALPKVLKPPDFFANNANSAVRRDLWEAHPFDESLPGLEDVEWAKYWMERGYDVVYAPEGCIYHIHAETWPQVRRRYYREGQAAKWIGIRGRRHIPGEVLQETRYLCSDLAEALRRRRLREKMAEVVRFRYEKLRGRVGGIWNGATTENPMRRRKLLFDRPYKAVVVRGPGRAAVEDVELAPLRPGEVLVRVAYTGVCATDLEVASGELGYYKSGLAKYPIVPGHEFSGTVAAVGTRVSDFREGDRVVVECIQSCGVCPACRQANWIGCRDRQEVGVIGRDGGYAQYVATPGRFVHLVPPEVSLKEACLCEPLAVVLKGLRRLEASWNHGMGKHKCGVMGAGTIGHLAASVLAQQGHQITVFDRNPERLASLSDSGIRTQSDRSDLGGFDSLIEATGNLEALEWVLRSSGAGCSLLLLGLPYGKKDFNFEEIVGYDKSVIGSVGSGAADFDQALQVLTALDLRAFTGKVLPLDAFKQAWSAARAGEFLKVLLAVDETGA